MPQLLMWQFFCFFMELLRACLRFEDIILSIEILFYELLNLIIMNTFIFIFLVAGILLQVVQYILEAKFGKSFVLLMLKAVAYMIVAGASCLLVIVNQQIFKEFEGYACSVILSLFVPRMIYYLLGAGQQDKHDGKILV